MPCDAVDPRLPAGDAEPEWAKLARLCRLEVDQVLHIAESVSELTFDGLLAAEAPASLHVQMYETTDTMLATVRRIVDVCEMLSMWPAGLIGLARLVKKKPHALLRATRLELVGLDLEVASGSLKYGATMCGVMAAIFLCGLEQLPADSFTRGPASVKRESSVNSGLTSASGASASGRQLSKLSLQHVHLGSRGSQALSLRSSTARITRSSGWGSTRCRTRRRSTSRGRSSRSST